MTLLIDAILLAWVIGASGAGVVAWRRINSRLTVIEERRAAQPPEIGAIEAHIEEWWQGYYAAPEGSPKRAAYENRLRSVGAI